MCKGGAACPTVCGGHHHEMESFRKLMQLWPACGSIITIATKLLQALEVTCERVC